jgi:hypothetical protein
MAVLISAILSNVICRTNGPCSTYNPCSFIQLLRLANGTASEMIHLVPAIYGFRINRFACSYSVAVAWWDSRQGRIISLPPRQK